MNRNLKALVALTFMLVAAQAQAEEFVGFMAGPSFANLGLGTKLGFGFETAGKLDSHWSLGFLVNIGSLGTNNNSAESAILTTFLGGVTYHAWTNNEGPWIGLRGGVGVVTTSNSIAEMAAVGGSTNSLAAGGCIGFDKRLGAEWTWGPQGQAIVVKNDNGNLMVFNVMLGIRYWPE